MYIDFTIIARVTDRVDHERLGVLREEGWSIKEVGDVTPENPILHPKSGQNCQLLRNKIEG